MNEKKSNERKKYRKKYRKKLNESKSGIKERKKQNVWWRARQEHRTSVYDGKGGFRVAIGCSGLYDPTPNPIAMAVKHKEQVAQQE